jgi:hypothetical protein
MPFWGDWYTSWCRLPGLASYRKGEVLNVPASLIISTSLYVNATVSPLMANLVNSAVGHDVTHSKGEPPGMACTNPDGQPHGVWVQEHMGYARQIQTMTYTVQGSGCDPPPQNTVITAQLNWPDPQNTGYRAFGTHCDWDDIVGSLCSTNSPYNIAGNT